MSYTVFISYRRKDSIAEARLVQEALIRKFGKKNVFMDVASIEPGMEWSDEIEGKLRRADAVVVVIGPEWLRADSDQWGMRRIDDEKDWVRKELTVTMEQARKVIPLLVRNAGMPPAGALPAPIRGLVEKQALSIRSEYWAHDIKLLLAQLAAAGDGRQRPARGDGNPYPVSDLAAPAALPKEEVKRAVKEKLPLWERLESPLPHASKAMRVELFRQFKFKSFAEAIGFMQQVVAGCDIANHHPRWENIFKTVRVYLSTWDQGLHDISQKDIDLACYFDSAFADYPGARLPSANKVNSGG